MRLAWPFLALACLALAPACSPSPENPFVLPAVNGDDGDDDDEPVLVDNCAGIAGTFQAVEIQLTNLQNPDIVAAFDDDLTDFRLTFASTIFTSRFDRPGIEPFVQTGRYDVVGDEIVFTDVPLMPGLSAGQNRFECRILEDDERVLLIGSGVSYDFGQTGTLQPALFEAELEAL